MRELLDIPDHVNPLGMVYIGHGAYQEPGRCRYNEKAIYWQTYDPTTLDLKARAKQLKLDIPVLFLSLKDKETPVIAKILAGISVVYALSPIDLIPDFIPVIGYLDDLILLPALIALTIRFIPKEVFERNMELAKNLWIDGKPKKWYYAIPFVLVWVVVICLLLRILWG